jgi:hypothetical protein
MGRDLLLRVALAWVAISVLMLATNAVAIMEMRFPDPDDTLRLIQVRDLLAGQGWFDLHQHRVDAAGGGAAMHWSRLVDIPLAASILILRPFFGQPTAEMITLVIVPLLTLGCALLLVGRIAWRMFGDEAAGLACLVTALSVPVITQLRPMRIDHHGWQIVLVLLAVNGLMARSPRLGGWITGLAIAAWLAISIEGLPLAAVIVALIALRWLRGWEDRRWLIHTMLGLSAGSLVLFAATRGLADLANHCDQISPVHLAMFAWGALVVTLLGSARPHPLGWTLAGFALAGGGALAMLFAAAPQCAGGAFVDLQPAVRHFWYYNVGEGLPVWRQPLADMLQIVIPPVFAIVASARIAAQSRDWLRRWWIDYTVLLIAALTISIFVARAGAVAGALSAVPLGWQLKQWFRNARMQRYASRRIAAMAGVALALVPAAPLTIYTLVAPAHASTPLIEAGARVSSCELDRGAATLAILPRGDVLAPLDVGPQILLRTANTVVATAHHRAGAAMGEVIGAFAGSAEHVHALVARRGIEYVAMCPGLNEAALYYERAPQGFAAQLRDGRHPAWLRPVEMPEGVDFRLWRVIG